ncbi:MAG: PKD domain-containing protein [Candidatus Saliniplasma sp.]
MNAVIQPLDNIMVIMEEPYMRNETVGKIATGLIVLTLVLSGLMVLQFGARADERQEGRVEGILSIEDATIPRGLEVNLIDLYENKVHSTETSKGGYFIFDDVDSGYYRVEFPSQSHEEQHVYFRNVSEFKEVEMDTTTEFDLDVDRKPLSYMINGTVLDGYDEPVGGTEITVEDLNSDYSNTMGLYNETSGEYRVPIYDGNFTITATAPDYPEIMHEIDVSDDTTLNITLTDDPDTPLVTGYLWSVDGGVNKALRVTLYNESMGMFHETIEEGPYFEIAVPRGGYYTLVIDSDGYLPYFDEELSVAGDEVTRIGRTEEVEKSADEQIHTSIEFGEDWDVMDVNRERTYQPDTMIQGMDYSNIGLLALQIDLAFGNGDLELDYSELQAFKTELEYVESNIPSSHRLITVDGISYTLLDHNFEIEFTGLNGEGDSISVFDMDIEISSTSDVQYEVMEEISPEDNHDVDLYLQQDHVVGNYRDYSYQLDLPDGYERTNFVENVDMTGFTKIDIDTYEGVEKTHVELNAQLSEPGEVDIILGEGPRVYRKEIEEDGEVEDHYIVREGTNVTCTADFVDAVGSEEDAEYTWYLDDDQIGTGDEINHIFTDTGDRTLKVEVLETGGNITTDDVSVFVDGQEPTGDIEGDFLVDEDEEFSLSAYNFTDDSGEIGYYQWNFSDGSDPIEGPELYNVTHTFDLHGNYSVKLNITDVVGNSEIYESDIKVNDTTPPVPLFNLTYQTEDEENVTIHSDDLSGDRIQERYPITLDASESYDPAGDDGIEGEVESYTWRIQEDEYEYEGMVLEDYEFDSIGEYTIRLNVTDEHGNYENISRTVRITMGPTPDLELTNLRTSGEKRDGEELTISVNVTNFGDRIAEDAGLEFSVDGEVIPVTEMTFEKDGEETNETIDTNEMKVVSFKWTPEEEGDMTLNVTVTDGDEPEELQEDNTLSIDINIEPPAWRRYLIYALVPIIIIGVTVGLYFYKEKFQ